MGFFIAGAPCSGIIVKRMLNLQQRMLRHTDVRIKLTAQLLAGIRVLKMYAWETALAAEVHKTRDAELAELR